jgi:hypothetical protein
MGVEAGAAKLPPPVDLCCALQDPGATPPRHSMGYGNMSALAEHQFNCWEDGE